MSCCSCHLENLRLGGTSDQLLPARTLIALPAIAVSVTTEMPACSIMSILALRVSGSASVGLNAKLVVNATNR
jgi:hypothetical protein